MVNIWRETANVRFSNVDCSDRISPWGIFDLFQIAATNHANVLGVGRDAMESAKQAWVLSRLSLFAERRPASGEDIQISTWPQGGEKLFVYREYMIKDAQEAAIVRGRGAWIVLDIEKRRPLRVQSVLEKLPPNEGADVFPAGTVGLEQRGNLNKLMERTALYSDIDCYGHVNNARYIQWIQDATDIDILSKAEKLRIDINYLSEVLPKETVEIWAGPLDSDTSARSDANDYPDPPGPGFAYEGRRPDSGQAVFRAELRTGG
ncbi:MAG: thioesterase [Treponema sp.]|nr:thioesterase [Treponema sp.]